jgi:hypothetical protein
MFRGEILKNCGSLVRHLPAGLVDFILDAFLETPEDRIDRFGGFSDHVMRELGVAMTVNSIPPRPSNSLF